MRFVRTIKTIASSVALIIGMTAMSTADAQWQSDPDDKNQSNANGAIVQFKDRIPRTQEYFDSAYGYAVLSSITRFGFGFGGAYGRGLVIEGEKLIGETGFWQFTSGIQAGAKFFSMIVFFKDEEALMYFKTRNLQFLGQSGLTVGPRGVNGTPSYNDGVAIFALTRFGLMGEFTISGAKFTYKDLPEG